MSHNNTIKTSNNEETPLIHVNDNVTLNIGSCDDFIKTLDDRTVQIGSGTTGSACYNLDRKCLLNDMNLDVVDIVKSRFS